MTNQPPGTAGPAPRGDRWRTALPALAFVGCVSVGEWRILLLLPSQTLQSLRLNVYAAVGVLTGHPIWITHQNRWLGPLIVKLLSTLTHFSYPACYQAVCFAVVLAVNGLGYGLFRRGGNRHHRAEFLTLVYAFLFLTLQDNTWLYLWDYLDLVTMLIFSYAVSMRIRSLRLFSALFLVQVCNRETAIFIALWLVIDSIQLRENEPFRWPLAVDARRLLTGLFLGGLCLGWTSFIRNQLLIEAVGTVPYGLKVVAGQWWTLPQIVTLWHAGGPFTALIPAAFLGLLADGLMRARVALGAAAWKIALLTGIIAVSILCFANPFELRVWLTLAPWIPCLALARATSPEPARTCASFPVDPA